MWILTRYIMWTILKSITLVGTIMCGIFIIFTFIAEMGDLTQKYTALSALFYVFMILPQNINIILPVIGFLGTLIGLNQLARHNELIAMRTAGMSLKRISVSIFMGAFFVMVFSFIISSYLGPILAKQAAVNKAMNQGNQTFLVTPRSTWVKNGNDYILIDHSLPDGRLANIKRFHIVHNHLTTVTEAKTAVFEGDHWRLENVVDTIISPKKIMVKKQKALDLNSLASPKLLKVLVSAPDQLTLYSLYQYIHYRVKNHLDAHRYQLQFWNILYSPLSIILLMLISVPFVFTGGARDHTAYKLIGGILLCFVFFMIQRFIMPFCVVYDIPPALGTAIPSLCFASFLMVLLFCLD